MRFLLIADLKAQRNELGSFILKAVLLLLLLLATDRLLGHWMLRGLETYYGLERPAEILLVGHSHTVLGVDKILLEKLTGLQVAKYARQGANAADRLAMLRQYLDRNGDNVKVVVYDVDAYSFAGQDLSANSHRLFYPFMNDPAIRIYLDKIKAPKWELAVRDISHTARFSEVTLSLAFRGWFKNWSNLKSGHIDVSRLEQQVASGNVRKISFDSPELEIFEETIKEAATRGVPLILAFYPTIDLYNLAQPTQFAAAFKKLSDYAADSEFVYFFDFVTELQDRHELFYDPIHMNPEGQEEVTRLLAEKLAALGYENDE